MQPSDFLYPFHRTGSIQAYSCYLKKDDDCALTGLATVTTNEFAEVVLGGSIAIPIAVASFGLLATMPSPRAFLPAWFCRLADDLRADPFGQILGTLWFSLLFFAGITSSVVYANP